MNWIQHNKKIAVIFGIMIAGALGLGVMLYLAWSDYSVAMTDWQAKSDQVTAMQNSKDYPTKENVEMAKGKLKEFREKFDKLRNALSSASLQRPIAKEMDVTKFQDRLKERAKAVKAKADQIFAKDKKLGPEFAMGFDDYVKDVPPTAGIAAELNVHLDVMEKLLNTLLDSGISSLDLIERTKLSGEKSAKTAAAAPTTQPSNQRTTPGLAPVGAPVPVLDRYPIKVIVTCDQVPLQRLMNALADPSVTPDFLAVRLFRVENTRTEAPTKEEIKNAIANAASQTPDAPKPPVETPGATKTPAVRTMPVTVPAKEDATDVLGAEPLKVYLEVDYIRLRDAQKVAAAPAKAEASR